MDTFLGTLAGIIFGGFISFCVSRFYYKKSIKKKQISCFVDFLSEILTDIAPDIKQKLVVDYAGQKVESLYQVQFIIANDGDYSIKDIIKPLTLKIPDKAVVLDANILSIEPGGRQVNLEVIQNNNGFEVEFNFPLLNSGEYFIAKLLIKGNIPRQMGTKEGIEKRFLSPQFFEFLPYDPFIFTITADELPPEIISKRLPSDYIETSHTGIDKSIFVCIAIIGTMASTLGYLLYSLKNLQPDLFLFSISSFLSNFSLLKFCIIIYWIIALVLAVLTVAIPVWELGNVKLKRQKKFKVSRKIGTYKPMHLLD